MKYEDWPMELVRAYANATGGQISHFILAYEPRNVAKVKAAIKAKKALVIKPLPKGYLA